MDDIYRHFNSKNGIENNKTEHIKKDNGRRQDKIGDEYEEGDVTGFAVQNPITTPVSFKFTFFRSN